MNKIEQKCLEMKDEVLKIPYVARFGVHNKNEKFIAVILTDVDSEDGETYTEISQQDKIKIKQFLKPFDVRFLPSPMLTFPEWLNGLKSRPDPITSISYKR